MFDPTFPDDSRIWIYGFRQRLTVAEKEIVESALREFVSNWKSHGESVEGEFIILHDQFVVLAAKPTSTISGCSIDSSVAVFKRLKKEHGFDALDRGLIFYRNRDGVVSAERDAFEKVVSSGRILPDTIVFDLSLETLGRFRSGMFEVPLSVSWLGEVFASISPQH